MNMKQPMKQSTIFEIAKKKVSKWDNFVIGGLLFNKTLYQPVKVIGDEHCFFRSCVQSGLFEKFRLVDHFDLREDLMEKIEQELNDDTIIGRVLISAFNKES